MEEAGVDVVDVAGAVEEASLLLTLPLLAAAVGKSAARVYQKIEIASNIFHWVGCIISRQFGMGQDTTIELKFRLVQRSWEL